MFTTDHDINRNISEAFAKVLLENASDKKIKKIADEYFGKMGVLGKRVVNPQTGEEMSYPKTESKPERPMFYDSAFLTNQCSELVPNCTLASRKFMPAVARIILPKIMRGDNSFTRDADELNKILKIIVNDQNHLNEYDNDLNGLSIEELKKRFGDTVKKNLEDNKKLVSSTKRTSNSRYKIIRCPEQKDLLPFGEPLTTWCVAQPNGEYNYNGYTNDGIGMFYVCLRDDYKTVKPVVGMKAPLDDYGLSMIAVNVNDDGSLKNCTCRWNHANGGNDNVMDEKQLSDLLGVNFYDTFKPRGVDEVWAAYKEQGSSMHDRLTKNTGWIKLYADGYIEYVTRTEDRIVKYAFVWHNPDETVYCLASDHFVWLDCNGKMINPPESASITGDSRKFIQISLDEWPELKSLKGLPKFTGPLIITSCNYLSDVSAMLDVTEYTNHIDIQNCKAITKEQIANIVNRRKDIIEKVLDGATDVNVANGFVSFKLPFNDLENFWHDSRDLVSFDTCNNILREGFVDYYYGGYFDFDNVSGDKWFDRIMTEHGVKLSWSDIGDIINGTVDDPEGELGITDEQYDNIRDMLDNDFHDEMSIETVNADCERCGAESEAQQAIMSAIQDRLPTYGTNKWDCYDGENIHLAIPFDAFVSSIHTLWTSENWMTECNAGYNGVTNFISAYLWDDDDCDLGRIEVFEPRYGWSGYDDEMWKEASTDFAYRVVKVITGVDPRDEKKKKNAE